MRRLRQTRPPKATQSATSVRRHDVANTLGLAVVFATTDNVATVARMAKHGAER